MAEHSAGVVVKRPAGGDSVHPEGRDVRLQDGHLLVFDGLSREADVVAIYAPGRWVSAEVKTATASS